MFHNGDVPVFFAADEVLKSRLLELVKDKVLTAQISIVEGSLPQVLLYDKEVCLNSDVFGIPADELLAEVEESEVRENRQVSLFYKLFCS